MAGRDRRVHAALARPGRIPPASIYAHIHTVYTDPDYRLRGYARSTVLALMDWLAEQGCTLITLNASDDGARLYRSLGFTTNERAMSLIRVVPDH